MGVKVQTVKRCGNFVQCDKYYGLRHSLLIIIVHTLQYLQTRAIVVLDIIECLLNNTDNEFNRRLM
jgi:hypothetical protein